MELCPRQFYYEAEIVQMMPFSKSTFRRWRKDGFVSNGLPQGPRRIVWTASEVDALVAYIGAGKGKDMAAFPAFYAETLNSAARTEYTASGPAQQATRR